MKTNKHCIERLSRYKSALPKLKSLGFVKVFSDNMADAAGVTSSQVRKDFSLFGLTGNKKGGYIIDELIEKLNSILGKNEIQKVIIVGAGNIGQALMKYKGFDQDGIKIAAAFDFDEQKVDRQAQIPVLPLSEMKDFVKNQKIKIGVVAVPESAASAVVDTMTQSGIKGILNFAPVRLRGLEDTIISSVNLVSELENVIYFVNVSGKAKAKK